MIDFKASLDEDQYRAVTHGSGPMLILAGAGSGKTRTLVHRVAWLIENGASPSSILILTFTNKAAAEMRERAVALLDGKGGGMTACTYHSFCNMMLRKYGSSAGVGRGFQILASPDANEVIELVKAGTRFADERGFPPTSRIAAAISMSRNTLTPLEKVFTEMNSRYSHFTEAVCELAADYAKYKEEHNLLDFDDLLTRFLSALDDRKTMSAISSRYKHILVDEYQDTNILQEKILMKLTADAETLSVVGDDYQSIYAFRGADINNILEFPSRFGCGPCDIVHIGSNYRSTSGICELANKVMSDNADFGFPKSMESARGDGVMPYVFMTKDDYTQVDCALHIIEHLHNKGIDYKDIAVLARSSRETFRLENMLDVRGIPYDKYGGLKFLEYRCVQDAIALTRIATAGGPDVSWFRVLRLLPGIGNGYAKMILNARGGSAGIDFLKSQKWKKRKFAGELSLLHDALAKASAMPFPGMLEHLADYYYGLRKRVVEQGVYENESNRSEALEILEDDKNTVSALMLLAQRYKSATEFLDSLVLDSLPNTPAQAKLQAEADGDEETDMLVVSTIHSVKGLEYHAVIILSCVDERLSFYGEGEMEALRCFYVAMTRAKDVLAMIVPLSLQFKEPVPAHISHFLPDRESGLYGVL